METFQYILIQLFFCTFSLLCVLARAQHIELYASGPKKAEWPAAYHIKNAVNDQSSWRSYIGEHFEIYSRPIRLKYAEVYYKFQEAIPLPDDVVRRFAGKQMAITGYEVDTVRFDADGNEESVPSYDAYNHHYVFFMKGSNWTDACVGFFCPPQDSITVSSLPHADAADTAKLAKATARLGDSPLDIQMFSEGNGNEYRGSFHGGPVGFAQVINSPSRLQPFIHLINTRGGGGRGGVGSRLLPRESNAAPGARYSGLIECPCTTRRRFDLENNTIDGNPPEIAFNCRNEIAAQRNPSCSLATYRGGLRCCSHRMTLLDEDQPDAPGEDEFFFKMRFWFEEAGAGTRNLFRLLWMTEDRNNEYDIPACKPTSPECVHTLVSHFTVAEMCETWGCGNAPVPEEGFALVYAAAHFHVGGISMELINADTGEQLCFNEATYGSGDEPRNEEGYLTAIAPCLWSDTEEGLADPPRLFKQTRLTTIAKYSTKSARYGAMALWQMRGAYI